MRLVNWTTRTGGYLITVDQESNTFWRRVLRKPPLVKRQHFIGNDTIWYDFPSYNRATTAQEMQLADICAQIKDTKDK